MERSRRGTRLFLAADVPLVLSSRPGPRGRNVQKMHKVVFSLAMVALLGCGAPSPTPSTGPSPGIAEASRARLEKLEAEAPEMARVASRLRELAVRAQADGESEQAREFVLLSDLTIVAGNEVLGRVDEAEQRVVQTAENANASCSAEGSERSRRVASADSGRRGRRGHGQRRRSSPPPDEAEPDSGEASESQVRERLAVLAGRLSEVEPTHANRVTLESVRMALIEADRALAAGELARAVAQAQEAERLLAPLGSPRNSRPEEGAETPDAGTTNRRRREGSG